MISFEIVDEATKKHGSGRVQQCFRAGYLSYDDWPVALGSSAK